MRSSKCLILAAAFFWSSGWIYSGPVSGEDLAGYQEGAADPLKLPAESAVPMPFAEAEAPQPTEPARISAQVAPVANTLQASPQTVSQPAPAPIRVNDGLDLVSLNVQNTDLAQVLQLLSIQGRRNIVPSPKVTGSVTANLYDVTFHEALDAILQQNGAGYVEKGNFIFIYTLDELKKIQEAERKVAHRMFRLNYMTAQDASTFVTPLLSSAGSISITGAVGSGIQPTIQDAGANTYSSYETMIVRDYPENLEEIAKIVESLDTRPQQVLIEATILQANLTEDLAFGVDLSILGDIGLGSFTGSPLNVVDGMISGNIANSSSGAVNSTVGNVASGDAGIKVGVLTDNVQVFVRALDSVTDTTILANPKVMTLNRQRAEVLVGEKVAYLSTTATATATTQTVEFLDTGTQLTVRPFVSTDGMIRMELRPSISSAELRTAGSGSGAVVLPDELTQELTTNVMIRDGQTVVLGGLFKEETTIERNQVPGLGDVPVLGNAFKGRDDMVNRSEVIFLITPHIVRDKEIAQAGEAALEGIEQIRIGTREHLLPWSRSKMTAAHLRDALRALEAGDRDTALWEVDLALGLNPSMVEARRLKEKLTGERVYWPESSLLNEAVDLMIEQKLDQKHPVPTVPVVPDPGPTDLQPVPNGRGASVPAPKRTPLSDQANTAEGDKAKAADSDDKQQPADTVPASKAQQPAAQPDEATVVPVMDTKAAASAPAEAEGARTPAQSAPAAEEVPSVNPAEAASKSTTPIKPEPSDPDKEKADTSIDTRTQGLLRDFGSGA